MVAVTGSYRYGDGSPASGAVTFTPKQQFKNGAIEAAAPVTGNLDVQGVLSVSLYATDDPATQPQNSTYIVVEQIANQPLRSYEIVVPRAVGTLDLATIGAAVAVPMYGYDLAGAASAAVAALRADPDPFPQYLSSTEANAAYQPVDSDLSTIAGLSSATAGVLATDGAGWLRKTYAQLKVSLGLVKADVGLGNVDNTADTAKPISTATATALAGKQSADPDLDTIAALDASTAGAIASDGAGWVKKTYAQFKTALALVKADVGLPNVDNTSDAAKPISNSASTALAGKQPLATGLSAIAGLDTSTGGAIATDGAGWVKKTYAQFKASLAIGAADLTATGTRDATTFLRGDNTWQVVTGGSGTGNVLAWDGATYQPASLRAANTIPRVFIGPTDPSTVSGVTMSANDYYDTWLGGTTDGLVDARDLIAVGQETLPRGDAASPLITMASGQMRLTYLTARKSETVTQCRIVSGGTGQAGTATLVRIVLYTVGVNGDLTQVAATASDTALLTAANTAYPKAFAASVAVVTGQRYAIGVIEVASTVANLTGALTSAGATGMNAIAANSPRINGVITGLSDIPASPVAAASVAVTAGRFYAELLP